MRSKKTAVVIGATGNIGSAVVSRLREMDYDVDPQWLSKDRPDSTIATSYSNLPDVIDAAIYIPGLNIVKPIETLSENEWDRVIGVNLRGAFLFAKAALPGLKAAGGSCFITISSILTHHPYPNRTAYAAAKAGLEGFTRSLAVEWGEYGISTHAIRLGHLSGFMKSSPANPALLDAAKENTPGKYLLESSDVASYISWLVEGGAKAVSGSVIDFDPAYCINRWPCK
jgi:NAD(P)-dependent dehydrogenase (short-subunit alcohol dehydrogenase family)